MAVNTSSKLWRQANLDAMDNRRVLHIISPSFGLAKVNMNSLLEEDYFVGKGVDVVDSGRNRPSPNTGSVVGNFDVVSMKQELIGSTQQPIKLQLGSKRDDFANAPTKDIGAISQNIFT